VVGSFISSQVHAADLLVVCIPKIRPDDQESHPLSHVRCVHDATLRDCHNDRVRTRAYDTECNYRLSDFPDDITGEIEAKEKRKKRV
jgi:hypothetical protein